MGTLYIFLKMGFGWASKSAQVEKWALYREMTHRHFNFTRKNLAYGFVLGVVVPIGLHSLLKADLQKQDEIEGESANRIYL